MLLCLPLFDDAALRRILPSRLLDARKARAKTQAPRRAVTIVVNAVALLMVFLSLVQMDERFGGSPPGTGAGDRRPVRAVPYREPVRLVLGHDHDPQRDHRRGVRRRRAMARVRISLQARRAHAPSAMEHPSSAAARLADVVRRARRRATSAVVFALSRAPLGKRTVGDRHSWKGILFPTSRRPMCAPSFTSTPMPETTMRPANGGTGDWRDSTFPKARLKTKGE